MIARVLDETEDEDAFMVGQTESLTGLAIYGLSCKVITELR